MNINITQIRRLLLNANELKGQLASVVYNQNEYLATIIRNVGSGSLAYNAASYGTNMENLVKKNLDSLDAIIHFLSNQIENYVVISTNAEEKINELSAKLSGLETKMAGILSGSN